MTQSPGGRALAAVFLAFALTHGVYQVGRALLHSKQGLDFTPEYIAARMMVDDGDLRFYDYDVVKAHGRKLGLHGPDGPDDPVINYAYPPWLPPVYVPVSRLPWDIARKVWFLLAVAAVFGGASLAAAAVAPEPAQRRAWALGGVAAACFFFPIPFGLMAGQANDIPLLGIAGCIYLLRTERPFLAGLALAPAAMWKVFPGFPVLALLARREWRAIGGLAAGCAALVLLSLPFVGVSTWVDWFHYMQRHNVLEGAQLRNHGARAVAFMLFQPTDVGPPWIDAPALARPVGVALQAIALALTAVTLLPAVRRDDPRYAVQAGATLALAFLLTPKAWEHYGVYLLPAFFACFAALAARPPARFPLTLAVLGAAFAVWAFLFQVKDEYRALAVGGARALLIPAKMYATYALLAVCAVVATRRDEAET